LKGSQCESNFACSDAGDPMYGYCFRHAQTKGLVSKERKADFEDKRVNAMVSTRKKTTAENWGIKSKEKREQEIKKLSEERKAKLEEDQRLQKEKVQELIHKILGDQGYDAQEILNDLKGAKADFKYTLSNQKFIFIGWYTADPLTRKPGTLKELCKIVGISVAEGRDWIDSDWFATDLHNSVKKMMKLAMPYLSRVNLARALGGDFNSFKEQFRIFGKHEKVEGEEDWDEVLGEEIATEVEGIGEMN